jgi:hypothetical protein
VSFWVELIEKYLKPLEKDAEKEKQMGNALKELRNQVPILPNTIFPTLLIVVRFSHKYV